VHDSAKMRVHEKPGGRTPPGNIAGFASHDRRSALTGNGFSRGSALSKRVSATRFVSEK